MKGDIGYYAGKVWSLLDENVYMNFETLKKETSLSDADLWSAIGWLARENKIEIDNSQVMPVFSRGTNFYY